MAVIIPTRIIQIRQGALIDRLHRLNQSCRAAHHFHPNLIPHLGTYFRLNWCLLHICRHIEAYSASIQLFVSFAIPYFIVIYCFILFVLFFGNLHAVQKLLYWFAVIFCNVFIFEITTEAARIERMGRVVEVQCRRFYVRYSAFYRASDASRTPGKYSSGGNYRVLKVAELAVPERLKKYAFTIGGNNRITARTYDLVGVDDFIMVFLCLLINCSNIMTYSNVFFPFLSLFRFFTTLALVLFISSNTSTLLQE